MSRIRGRLWCAGVLAAMCGALGCADREVGAPDCALPVGLSVSAGAGSAGPGPGPSPGVYWPKDACHLFTDEEHGRYAWYWCVDSVELGSDGELTLRCRWQSSALSFDAIEKGPDENNRNMYIVDASGRRHDHVATTDAARLGGRLTREAPTMRGDFVFRARGRIDPPFVFHDDDQKVAITGIGLDPTRRTRPDESETLLGRIRGADRVEIADSNHGLGPPSSAGYALQRKGASAAAGAGAVVVPEATMDRFLATLVQSPLLRIPYVPYLDHTDDYPHFSMTVGGIVFFSESQGAERVPWGVEIDGTKYVIPSATPARALEILRPYLLVAQAQSR